MNGYSEFIGTVHMERPSGVGAVCNETQTPIMLADVEKEVTCQACKLTAAMYALKQALEVGSRRVQ